MERESGRFDVFCRNMRSAALERSSAVEIIHNNCIDLDRTSEHKTPTTLDDETKKKHLHKNTHHTIQLCNMYSHHYVALWPFKAV